MSGRRAESGHEPALEIRPCRDEDVEAITATEPPGADIARRTHERQQQGLGVYLVAWIGGDPVGSGELVLGSLPELRNLHVRADLRGAGIGSALIAAAVERSRDAGSLSVGVGVDNPAARRLYERLGFEPTGELTTTRYTYMDASGPHEAVETDERLVLRLSP